MEGSETGSTETPAGSEATGSDVENRAGRLVATGDLAVVTGVVVIGGLTHGLNPLTQPLAVIWTVAPFVFGWVLAAAVLGAYGPTALGAPIRSLRIAAGATLAAVAIGIVLRTSPAFPGGAAWPFPLVITATLLVGVLAWRGLYHGLLAARTGQSA